jgi:hypothetical protein
MPLNGLSPDTTTSDHELVATFRSIALAADKVFLLEVVTHAPVHAAAKFSDHTPSE